MEKAMFVHRNTEHSLSCPRREISQELRSFEPVTPLQQAIRTLRTSKDITNSPERLAKTGQASEVLLESDLHNLVRTRDGNLYYFDAELKRLLRFGSKEFTDILSKRLGIGPGERDGSFRSVVEQWRALAVGKRPIPIHVFSFYDSETGTLSVSDGGGRIYQHVMGNELTDWEILDNGTDGLFFFTYEGLEPWTPDFTCPDTLNWFTQQICFDPNVSLTQNEQETLLQVFLIERFFPCLQHDRIIPAFIGPPGSGKTTAVEMIGQLLEGKQWSVTVLASGETGEEKFWTEITNQIAMGIDNADSPVPWLEKTLATYATGASHKKRKLYTDNELEIYRPIAALMITSKSPYFRANDVAQRLLQFYCAERKPFSDKARLYGELARRRGEIMGSLLIRAAAVTETLQNWPLRPTPFRLADFASLGEAIMRTFARNDEWEPLLAKLAGVQVEFAASGHPLVESLSIAIASGKLLLPADTDVVELYHICLSAAPEWAARSFKSVQPFSNVLRNMKPEIEKHLKVNIEFVKLARTTRVRIQRAE